MNYRMSPAEMLQELNSEKINTWFDLGLFIDRIKENKPVPTCEVNGAFEEYKEGLGKAGMAFVTFFYSIDGVTIEVEKYAKIFKKNMPGIGMHYIAGKIYPEASELIPKNAGQYEIPEAQSFNDWALYEDFFHNKIQRGSEKYNELILKFWKEVLIITQKLGEYIQENNIKMLYLINTNSNPGNVSLALSTVLVSEFMGIPVINNNHDFYWEGGNSAINKKVHGLKAGPRDHFFLNADVGEFFSIIEMIYPWESRSWINVNINQAQSDHLISINGHNPANVTEIGTAVDTNEYIHFSKRDKINAFYQFERILSRYEKKLISYSVSDVIKHKLVQMKDPMPILIGAKTKPVEEFLAENIILLQPTRIISRKRIEIDFRLINKMFNEKEFADRLKQTGNLKLTILVTGPIATGHGNYFLKLLNSFEKLLTKIDVELRQQIFIAFLFSELDKEEFKNRFEKPVGIPDLYNIASLVLLPSKTEGRGLPIIEATACGTPILCRRYTPEDVYKDVIGEHLPEKERLKVIDFQGKKITSSHARRIIRRVLFPHNYSKEVLQNQEVVKKRYSLESLNDTMMEICRSLYYQLKNNQDSMNLVARILAEYKKKVSFWNEDLEQLINCKNRHYLPGNSRLSYMIYLKSLIDPSYFRVEEQNLKGEVFAFAQSIIHEDRYITDLDFEKKQRFYNAIDNMFRYRDGEVSIKHDHSFAYRHRNTNYYPYQDYTFHELTGVIFMLYYEIINPKGSKPSFETAHFYTDWNLALSQLTSRADLGIDDRATLTSKMKMNLPIALFPGEYIKYELEFFALQSVRARLKLKLHKELTEDIIKEKANEIEPIFVFTQERSLGKWMNKRHLTEYLKEGKERELRLLHKYNVIRIIETQQICSGIHFNQMGADALKVLRYVQDKKGYMITNRRFASIMTDIVGLDRFHIGNVTMSVTANILGIPVGSGFIQFVPASVRATLAYPTPVQRAKDFSKKLHSFAFKSLVKKYGEEEVYRRLKEDAETNNSPISYFIENFENQGNQKKDLGYQHVSGVYDDGLPWNGVMATAYASKDKTWQFETVASTKTKTVTKFVTEFITKTKKYARLAWNGGYILNAELVGKLGLPEAYIGSPLGLLISDFKPTCPPLFNKAALLIFEDGRLDVQKVNCSKGLSLATNNDILELNATQYNSDNSAIAGYYDLLYTKEEILADGRTIIRLAGNTIKEIIPTQAGENIKVIPVGICLALPVNEVPKSFSVGKQLKITIAGLENVRHAVEAGPLLVDNGEFCLDMEDEGWKTKNSIRTQAARLDYIDMRGPKIAVGLDEKGNLTVLTINGRIRESVGATHIDMANILMKFGITKAMGFDPGGSSTLVVDGQTLNISPYNKDYEMNIYSLPPQPRAVSNAVIGYLE